MRTAQLRPTPENTWHIVYVDLPEGHAGSPEGGGGVPCDFGEALRLSQHDEAQGRIEAACNRRFEAFQALIELIPDSTDLELDWDDENSREAMVLIYYSAIDHFLVGDFEMCAAMLEMLLELDPEDHLETSKRLAYAYVALEEWELFDEVINDISDKHADKELLALWSEYRRTGAVPQGELHHFRRSFSDYYAEFTAGEHPADDEYLAEIGREHPSKRALARELWLQTEHLWEIFPGFIDELKKS